MSRRQGARAYVRVLKTARNIDWRFRQPTIWHGDARQFLKDAPDRPLFDLVITSPPYNIGKEYERKGKIADYFLLQRQIIEATVRRLKPNGSICWQVGNFVQGGQIFPLDLEFHKIFRRLGLQLRNRIIWRYGHGLHSRRRFSGRYEVVLWYTKSANYTFNLDSVRIPSKYPGKKHYKGKNKGKYSANPLGKNPEDVWDIPNVKGNHIEKTIHPCQFPVGLVERLVLGLTNKGGVVFDPFAGVASAGVAALLHKRRFVGCERLARYGQVARARLLDVLRGQAKYRPHDRAVYDHKKSKLSIPPQRN